MSEWKEVGEDKYRMVVGSLWANVKASSDRGVFFYWIEDSASSGGITDRVATRHGSLNECKAAAEQALREMHDALSEHFAPVLRWADIHPSLSTARLGEWMIDVTNGGWYLFVLCEDGRKLIRHAVTIEEWLSHAERKRAAEASLRALGVMFRVEGES